MVTHHSITVNGKTLNYTATVAQMPLKNASGETEAHIFYMAYTLDGADPTKRPLTFCFNGGPGSASMWVHMGGMGPRSPKLMPNGGMPPPPYQLKDNRTPGSIRPTWFSSIRSAPATAAPRPSTSRAA